MGAALAILASAVARIVASIVEGEVCAGTSHRTVVIVSDNGPTISD
jgi:hypothetical protein